MVDGVSDDELAALAMDAALDGASNDPFDDDAVPFGAAHPTAALLLPEWYMPVPQRSAATRTPRRTCVVALIILALVVVNGAGLCVTYGLPEIAW